MKKFDLGQTIGILANIGVIAGIMFLAVEIRQNNELLSAEARLSRTDRGLERYAEVFQNTDLAIAFSKLRAGEELDGTDEILIEAYALRSFRNWEANFDEASFGTLELDTIANSQRLLIRGGGSLAPIPWQSYWEVYKGRASPDFVEWMETRILPD